MKVLSCFAKVADKEKFLDGGYFIEMPEQFKSGTADWSERQKRENNRIYHMLCELDDLPTFDIEVELSTAQTMFDLSNEVNRALMPIVDADSLKVIVNLTIRMLDKLSNTWHTHKDKILLEFRLTAKHIEEGTWRSQYVYMLKQYLKEILEQDATYVSADDIMEMMRLEVDE